MKTIQKVRKDLPIIEEKLGYHFNDPELLILAFIHRSYINEDKQVTQHNERLEFLGDSILGLLVAEYLYRFLPDTSEGDLSTMRSRLVEASSCMIYAQQLELQNFILMGKGERMNDGKGRESITADLLEAIIGAIYLDGGLESARKFLFEKCGEQMNAILKTPLRNWKALLQDFSQRKFQSPPDYKLISESGPDHSKEFLIAVEINGVEYGRGSGHSKKEAQQSAAEAALKTIEAEQQ
jgi:ribonuclease-3